MRVSWNMVTQDALRSNTTIKTLYLKKMQQLWESLLQLLQNVLCYEAVCWCFSTWAKFNIFMFQLLWLELVGIGEFISFFVQMQMPNVQLFWHKRLEAREPKVFVSEGEKHFLRYIGSTERVGRWKWESHFKEFSEFPVCYDKHPTKPQKNT